MIKLPLLLCAGLAITAAPAAAQVSYLMALNSSSVAPGRRVMLFSHVDGSLINDNFINESTHPNGWALVKGIVQVGDDIWISDQTRGLLYRYDQNGNYIQTIGDGILSNVRGFAYDDGIFYITNAGTTGQAPQNSIAKLDLSGNYLGAFIVGSSPFDAFILGPDELLVGHSTGGSDITRWDFNGNSLGLFHAGSISWAQQITQRSNGNLLVAGWSSNGIYEYDLNGTQVNRIGVDSPRAAFELENGNIFWTGGGFNVYDTVGGFNTQIAGGTGQYIAPFGEPEPPCYANCDGSTTEPVLTVDDFTCFINEFAQAQTLPVSQQITHYANCDGSTTEPILTVDDFTCFINEFAQGCP